MIIKKKEKKRGESATQINSTKLHGSHFIKTKLEGFYSGSFLLTCLVRIKEIYHMNDFKTRFMGVKLFKL
jgi:hypothetical protein